MERIASQGRVPGLDDLFVEFFHVFGFEWRSLGDHFVQDAAQGPDVALLIVGLVLPHFGTRVVWRACLSMEHALLDDF